MSDVAAPKQTVTFTITKVPHRIAQRKTIQRLMRMQPHIQIGLRKLARRRRRVDNKTYPRAGRFWTERAEASKIVHVVTGASFTIVVTPQILKDIKSVEPYLKSKRSG
jgi:hypothetical protein